MEQLVKLVHAADLHLDSPLSGLERYEGAPVEQIQRASRRALENLVELCIEEGAALLLIAGDVFDGEWRDYSTGLFFASQMAKLYEAGVHVAWIRGNHDAACRLTKHLELPRVSELPCDRPGSVVWEELGVAVHGQGFATQAVTRDLAAAYPAPIAGFFNVGLLHTAVEGAEGHAPYAPCRLEALINKGYAYWALGHVHRRTVLHEDPWVVFPGNLQGRSVREVGAKGASVVVIDGDRVQAVEHRPLDVVRYDVCRIDATGIESADDIIDRAMQGLEASADRADGLLLAARVVVEGATRAHSALETGREQFIQQLRGAALYLRASNVWLEKVQLRTRAELDLAALRRREDATGELLAALDALRENPAELAELVQDVAELRHKLPSELSQTLDALRFEDPAILGALLDDVEQLLLPRLLSGSDA